MLISWLDCRACENRRESFQELVVCSHLLDRNPLDFVDIACDRRRCSKKWRSEWDRSDRARFEPLGCRFGLRMVFGVSVVQSYVEECRYRLAPWILRMADDPAQRGLLELGSTGSPRSKCPAKRDSSYGRVCLFCSVGIR